MRGPWNHRAPPDHEQRTFTRASLMCAPVRRRGKTVAAPPSNADAAAQKPGVAKGGSLNTGAGLRHDSKLQRQAAKPIAKATSIAQSGRILKTRGPELQVCGALRAESC